MAVTLRSLQRSLLQTAKLYDESLALKTMLPILSRSLRRSGAPQSAAVAKTLDEFLAPHGVFSPDVAPPLRAFARAVLRRPLPQDATDHVYGDPVTLAAVAQRALLQLATVASAHLGNAGDLVLPQLGGVEGTLASTDEIEQGNLMIRNPIDMYPGRDVLLIKDVSTVEVPSKKASKTKTKSESESKSESKSETAATAKKPRKRIQVSTIAVNRPYPARVGATLNVDLGPLNDNFFFVGGTDDDFVYLLHRFPELAGAQQLTENGLAAGGSLEDIARMLEKGLARAEDFKVVVGSTNLFFDRKVEFIKKFEGGFVAKGSAVRDLCLVPALLEAPQVPSEGEPFAHYDHHRFFHQNVLWAECVRRVGEPFAGWSDLHPAVVEAVDATLMGEDSGAAADEGEGEGEGEEEEEGGVEDGVVEAEIVGPATGEKPASER